MSLLSRVASPLRLFLGPGLTWVFARPGLEMPSFVRPPDINVGQRRSRVAEWQSSTGLPPVRKTHMGEMKTNEYNGRTATAGLQ